MPFMPALLYQDTRGLDPSRSTFSEAVLQGIARGGGLFVPESLPRLATGRLLQFASLSYPERATQVFRAFAVDLPDVRLGSLLLRAYGENFDHPAIAPVRPVGPNPVLELWHGPTAAFKDMALQAMPLFFAEAIRLRRESGQEVPDFLVLVATSGDTGKAALEGFADRDSTSIVVLYPAEGVSDLQRLQMVTQRGDNVAVFGVRGNFDDCQNAVKAVFADEAFAGELREQYGLSLSSANSINWGRLLPQVVYYVSAYADLVAQGGLREGQPLDVCVPTGNFGNILAAFYAKRIGVPLGRLLCASNENNVLTDFLRSGVYDIVDRPFRRTPSPSMDILISSNLERCLFELTRDPEKIGRWMEALKREGRFEVDRTTFAALQEHFVGDFVSNDDSLRVIARIWHEQGYLLDPHSAVAWEVAERHRREVPVLVVSTAHWAKFGTDVYRALTGMACSQPLPDEITRLGPLELLENVCRLAPGETIPPSLASLAGSTPRFCEVIDRSKEDVLEAVRSWLAARD
jgi:threonine synthase